MEHLPDALCILGYTPGCPGCDADRARDEARDAEAAVRLEAHRAEVAAHEVAHPRFDVHGCDLCEADMEQARLEHLLEDQADRAAQYHAMGFDRYDEEAQRDLALHDALGGVRGEW